MSTVFRIIFDLFINFWLVFAVIAVIAIIVNAARGYPIDDRDNEISGGRSEDGQN